MGELGGIVPYTSYSAKASFIEKNPDLIKKFTDSIQKGLDFVNNNNSETIAKAILSFFPDTSLNDLTKVIERYKSNEAWPTTTVFKEEDFNHLQDIMISAKELEKKVSYKDLIYIPNE